MPKQSLKPFDILVPCRPDKLKELLRNGSFDKEVRSYLIRQLPFASFAPRQQVWCPWCGNWVGPRETQRDHVIPMLTYIRYRLLERARMPLEELSSADDEYDEDDMDQAFDYAEKMETWYSDRRNIFFVCSSCNAGKSDDLDGLPDRLRAAHERMARLQASRRQGGRRDWAVSIVNTLELRRIVDEIANADAFDRAYMRGEWTPPTEGMTLRSKKLHQEAGPGIPVLGSQRRPEDVATLTAFLGPAQDVILRTYTKTRPALDPSLVVEWDKPLADPRGKRLHRLCLYCLGLFGDGAFHIDHIRPLAGKSRVTKAIYNDFANLLAVCRTCNTRKGSKPLTRDWLNKQICDRVVAQFPGLEDSELLEEEQDRFAAAIAYRNQVLGRIVRDLDKVSAENIWLHVETLTMER